MGPFARCVAAASPWLTVCAGNLMVRAEIKCWRTCGAPPEVDIMKIRNSLKSLQKRHRDNRVVRRRGRLYVINKTNRRFKARQG